MRSPLLTLSLLGAMLVPLNASADGSREKRAEKLFEQGVSLSQQEKWKEATAKYAASLALERHPMTLYALGVAQREAEQPLASLRSFRAFLAEPKPANQSPADARTFRRAAQEAVDDLVSKVGRIIVRSSTPHAVVAVDGTGCALAEPCFVSPGKHEVVVHATGHDTTTQHVSVFAGGTRDITVTLDATESSPWPFVLMGVGGAALIGGVALTAVGVSASMDTTDPSAGTVTEIAIGNTLMAAGLASAAAGYTWWALEPSADTAGAAVVVGPTWSGVKVAF